MPTVSRFRAAAGRWRGTEAGGLARDSFWMSIQNGATALAELAQIALITHGLGLADYGRLGLATASVLIIGGLLDLRVGVAATVVGARRMREDRERAAGIFQFTYLVDGGTGVAAFVIVCALAPFLGPGLVGEDGTLLMVLFAVALLASTLDDSSISVLRLLDRFRVIAGAGTVVEVLRVAAVAVAVLIFESLIAVVLALVAARTLGGLANAVLAARAFKRTVGVSLWRPALGDATDVRSEMWRMMLHTNVVSYSRVAQTQLPPVLIGALATTLQVGAYKVGMAAALLVAKIADPAYAAILPRLSKLWAEGATEHLRQLIRTVAAVAFPALAAAALLLVLAREPALTALGGHEAADSAQTVLVLGALAHAINSGLFWNGGLLFAAGRSAFVSRLAIVTAVLQVALLIPLVSLWGAEGAALALLITFVVVNAVATRQALVVLRSRYDAASLGRRTSTGRRFDAPR